MNFASSLEAAIFQNASEYFFLVSYLQMKIASYFLKLFETSWGLWKWWKNGIAKSHFYWKEEPDNRLMITINFSHIKMWKVLERWSKGDYSHDANHLQLQIFLILSPYLYQMIHL